MLKINTSLLFPAIVLSLCIIISCNKPERDTNKQPEAQVKTDTVPDPAKNKTEPYIDTIPKYSDKSNKDSLEARNRKKRKNDSLKALKETEVKILAYYFHPTARCVTCRNIEAYSLEAVHQWEEKNKKKITWQELNIEDSVNEHYVKEYSLEFSSLVIVKYIGGKKDKWKNLEDTWKLVNDKSSLIKYVTNELTQFAKKSNE